MVTQKMKQKRSIFCIMLKSLENLTINDISGSNTDESEFAAADNTNKMDTKEKYVMPALEDTDDGEGNLRDLGVLKKTSLLQKDFKIESQIGEAGQRDKISYVILIQQINEAKSSSYNKEDIIDSVIRARAPSLTLRNVLETTPHLSLKNLMQYLEAHFDERSANDLCSKLTSMTQLPEESAYSFVMRCIKKRQKVILATMKSDIKYDKNLVCKLFYKTVEKGISSSYVVQEIKESLRHRLFDEDFIVAATKASESENERIAAQSKARKKVFEVSAETDQTKKWLSAVEGLSKQVSSLESELSDVKQGSSEIELLIGVALVYIMIIVLNVEV